MVNGFDGCNHWSESRCGNVHTSIYSCLQCYQLHPVGTCVVESFLAEYFNSELSRYIIVPASGTSGKGKVEVFGKKLQTEDPSERYNPESIE